MSASAPSSTAKAILTAGFIVGTLDILAATIQTLAAGGTVMRLLQYVARGALDKETAYAGGWTTAACGLLFHYVNAFAFTVFFFAIYPRIPLLAKNRVLTGIGYGIFVWAVMNLIVVPASRIGPSPLVPSKAALACGILIVCIGLPLSFLAHRHFAKRAAA